MIVLIFYWDNIDEMLMLLKSQFLTGVISEIKKLRPGTVLVTGKPRHSESNGVLRDEIGLLKKKFPTECITIILHIGHKHYPSYSGVAIHNLTGTLVIGPLIT